MARKSDKLLFGLWVLLIMFLLSLVDVAFRGGQSNARLQDAAHLAGALELTDLSLFTEAGYTRHPSQSDLHSAFQDHPMSLEHFPSGSLISPPGMQK